ncbi:MAG: T9SS type A sorting domain-containing protein [Thermoanaerobaculia bacterium]|nr:T9SS type A sorting domain-containing protein [Thermoanaerobaculia bacterium]
MNFFPRQLWWLGVMFFLTPSVFSAQSPCPTPIDLKLLSSSSVYTSFSWTGSGLTNTLYQWEIGFPGFNPGNNQFIVRDTTSDTADIAFGLVTSTLFELRIRAICGNMNGDTSNWSLPLQFSTPPGCNEEFTDPGGPLGNYPNGVTDTVIICPQSDSEVVKLTFLSFATEQAGDVLKIFDGNNLGSPLLATLSGVYLPPLDTLPGPFVATNPSGCLSTLFSSNGQNNNDGWAAFVTCVKPDSCLGLADLSVDSVSGTFAKISWTALFGADLFEWELGIAPFDTSGTPVLSDTTSADTLTLNNLSSQTDYVLLLRSRCDSTSYSHWFSISFSTPISCGDTLYDSGGADEDYFANENYTTTICPDSAHHTVTLTFLSFKTQQLADVLSIYDGTSISAPFITAFAGNLNPLPPPITATNATGCLTLQFVSNGTNEQEGWEALITCDTATDCFDPLDLKLDFVSSDSAAISWTGIFGAMGYVWELDTVAFAPGTGSALLSDTVSVNALYLDSLESGQSYFVYIKTKCASDTSAWFGPLEFVTPPGCGDNFYDSGGPNQNYSPNEDYTTVICPDAPGEVVSLTFSAFDLGNGDTLSIYNGDSINPLLILATLKDNPPGPGPFTATVASGCLTVRFTSDGNNQKEGWEAAVTCAPPADCNPALLLKVDSVEGAAVHVSWAAMAGAVAYEWKIGLIPYAPGSGMALDSGVVTSNTLYIDGLTQLTNYSLWIRTLCAGDTSSFQQLTFTTTVNCFSNANVLECNETATAISVGTGAWLLDCSFPSAPTLGQENVYQFTAPVSKTFKLVIDQVNGINFTDFYYKPASDGCNPDGWNCIGNTSFDTLSLGPLIAGINYLILADPQLFTPTSIKFRIIDCAPLNENADSAITLIVNEPCTGNVHANGTADYTTGEPDPDSQTDVSDLIAGRWITEADQTVWFKFVAPASGTVTISTDQIPLGDNYDSQVALYSATDPADYSTFEYIESDEDNGTAINGFSAVLYYTGLTPGESYYVQVDGFGTSSGTFCIEVLDGIYRYNDGSCIETYAVAGVDGTQPGGDRWYGIYGGQDNLDQGRLIAAIKPGVQNLDTVFCQLITYTDSIPVSSNGIPYMPAYFNFSSSVAPAAPVELRLFFYNYELDALKLRTQLFNNTAADLVVSHYSGQDPDCSPLQHSTADVILLDTGIVSEVHTSGTASFYLEFKTTKSQLGEFGAHFGLIALPVELKSFAGSVHPAFNRLNWVTALEKNVQWHIVERSQDGVNWTETGRLQGAPASYQERRYQLEDKLPLPQAYYRLRTLDLDGKQQISNAIHLVRENEQLRIAQAFPSPTPGSVTVQFVSPEEGQMTMRIIDLNSRAVLEQEVFASKGLNSNILDISHLQAGIYLLNITGAHAVTVPYRIVKQ